jgi:uncharacterized protein YyaL (SSP411 family)
MCEDNAKWLQLYLHAYQATADPLYREIAKGIIDYVNGWLSDREQGCFYGSQDADEEYYKLTKPERLRTTAPYVDKHIYTNWNAMMITSYLDASFVLDDPAAGEFAAKSLNRLLLLSSTKNAGMSHFYDGQPRLQNQLIDQVQTAGALIHAYECTGESTFLNQAYELLEFASTKLRDHETGGFFDTAPNADAPGFLGKPIKPLDENSVAARTFMKLYHITENATYRKLAEEALKCFADTYSSFGFMAADYALAVDAFLNEPTMIRIVGSKDRPETKALLTEAVRTYEPRKIIQILDPQRDAEEISRTGYSALGQSTAYICVGTACTSPITQPKEISSALRKIVAAHVKE